MTVQKNLVKNIYVGNGSTTQFPITFDVNTEHPEYIHVYLTNDDNITTETENFTVNLTAKTVTYPKEGQPLATGKKLVIMRELPLQQLLDLINQGDFFADDIEQAFDDLTMITQQLSEKLARAMVFSVEVDTANFSNIIPQAPGMSFRINDEGTGLEPTEDPAKVLPQAQNLLQQTTEQANIATNKANAAAESALAAATSETNAGAHEAKAQAWAESETSPDGEPDSKSAKTWAGESADSAELAQKWAESDESPDGETDTDSPTGDTMSSKEWALYAKQLAQQIGNPVVDVTESNGTVTIEKSDGTSSSFDIPQPTIATQEEAEAGTDNTKFMTPLRVAQAIDAQTQDLSQGLSNVEGRISELENNVSGIGGYVVETYQNDTEWYRIYSDGWVEQGGRGSGTRTFLKPFANANYSIALTKADTSSGGAAEAWIAVINKTATSFDVRGQWTTTYEWYACGKGAEE